MEEAIKTKHLIIDGRLFAKYEVADDVVFLKMIVERFPKDRIKSENFLIRKIEQKEKTKFRFASYLNIK
jgi:hypothetical protein